MGQTFKNFTDLDAAMHNARVAAGKGYVVSGVAVGDDEESKLHQQIEDYCKQRRWYYVHSRMDRATTTALGVPDFIIAAENQTHWIEAKGPKTKVTREQEGTMHWLQSLGHNADIVRSFPEFLSVIHRENKDGINQTGTGKPGQGSK